MKKLEIEVKKRKNREELLMKLITYGVVVTLILYGYFVWLMIHAK